MELLKLLKGGNKTCHKQLHKDCGKDIPYPFGFFQLISGEGMGKDI